MEEAIFITQVADFKKCSDRYSRVYFGNEFCQKLTPTSEELEDVLGLVLSRGLNFTFVTGFVTDSELIRLQDSLAIVSAKMPNSEIVINDWGMLSIAKKHNLTPVLGRLLTKQRRDPRLLGLIKRMPHEAAECIKTTRVGPYFIQFLKSQTVERMEIDNLPQGIGLGKEGLRLSLYFPFNYVTTSRECIFNNGDCGRRCRCGTITLKHRTMPLPLHMKGNTIFLENRNIPEYSIKEGIDRVVYQPHIPM